MSKKYFKKVVLTKLALMVSDHSSPLLYYLENILQLSPSARLFTWTRDFHALQERVECKNPSIREKYNEIKAISVGGQSFFL